VLDAGCGTGGLIARLKPRARAWEWRGLDSSSLACHFARGRGIAEISEASVERLPFSAEAFDVILLMDVIGHVDDPDAALREAVRCLRPGGVLVLAAAAYQWMRSYHDEACGTHFRFSRPELVRRCERAGLEVERSTYLYMLTFPLLWLKRKLLRRRTDRSDVREYPPVLDATLGAVTAIERGMIAAGWRSPFGSTVFVVARRR
jgi:SAM-dependent methyltransferase